MSILIKTVRIAGFRCFENIEVDLEQTTILTGMNNSGKTSFLKALQLVLGSRQFVSQDDFFIQGGSVSQEIIIDVLIIPINDDGKQCKTFSDDWEALFTEPRIQQDQKGNAFISLRTTIIFDPNKNSYKPQQFLLQSWPLLKEDHKDWFAVDNGKKIDFYFEQIPFFYMDAQRDILDDIKSKYSFLGRLLSKLDYFDFDKDEIEAQIKLLNEKLVNKSAILTLLNKTLKDLDTAMDTRSEGVEITPVTKKVRDLNKKFSIYYTDQQDSFSMEYHGMGTRSWSSLLTLKTFIKWLSIKAEVEQSLFFPILAIEEPETHLHPNAQKKLYGQIHEMSGQKIIATHSPYIAAMAKLGQIRNFYKDEVVTCGKIKTGDLKDEDIRKINRQVINTRGEIFFSKVLVFVEGETEEQALPIFAQKHFNKTPFEMGVDFVGVSGSGNYLPFLRFAEALKIPLLIFSDSENKVKASVQSQFSSCGSIKRESECIVFLEAGNDFEKQLISDGFTDEIKQVIVVQMKQRIVEEGDNKPEQYKQAKVQKIENSDDHKLYKTITDSKTQYGPAIAEQIIQSDKDLPPKVIELFNKITTILHI